MPCRKVTPCRHAVISCLHTYPWSLTCRLTNRIQRRRYTSSHEATVICHHLHKTDSSSLSLAPYLWTITLSDPLNAADDKNTHDFHHVNKQCTSAKLNQFGYYRKEKKKKTIMDNFVLITATLSTHILWFHYVTCRYRKICAPHESVVSIYLTILTVRFHPNIISFILIQVFEMMQTREKVIALIKPHIWDISIAR